MERDSNPPVGRKDRSEQERKAQEEINKMSYQEMLDLIKKYQSHEQQADQNKSKGKIQGPKYEPQYEKQLLNKKLSQSILVHQNNPQYSRPRPQQERGFPQTKDKFNSNLDETSTGQYQPSDSQFSYSQSDQSNYLTYGNISRQGSTKDHTANTSNFSYHTKSEKNQNQQLSNLLEMDELNISSISANSQPLISKEQIKQLEEQFDETFKLLKHKKTTNNLLRAMTSRQHLRSQPNLYIEDKKTFLFRMMLPPPQNGISLNNRFFDNLQKTDHFLLNQVDIGVQVEFKSLLKIFEKYYQSLRKLIISREFDEQFEEHGFDFIKNIKNQEGLVQIEWKSAKLTETLASTFGSSKLTNLIQLTIDLDQKVEDEKECGNLIKQIFNNIDQVNQHGFKIVLCSSVEKKQNLGKKLNIYKNRMEIKPKRKNSNTIVKAEKQQKPAHEKQPQPSFNKKKKQSSQPQNEAQSKPKQQSNKAQQSPSQQPNQSFSGFSFTSHGGQIKNFSIGGNQYSK